ncbi:MULTISPECIES: SGNH/GDSL hydrolase family protein [unclassified Novosphingobium]|uniref:SGNH/GDSL hydrolase family protein n=1 Tax=unclassified Novosphingobium TaxID=2644732 RepID=UPI001356A7FF|nr:MULTISPECIES: SGNH/GDSL hydrolase family protein [unclassified Novosphingobium]
MGTIADKFAEAFRDYQTAGIPATGPYWPSKALIRAVGVLLDTSIGSAAAGLTILATTGARDTFYATPDNRSKLVYVNNNNGSASDAANGVYEYVSGAARLAQGFYAGVASVVQPLVVLAQTAANSAASSAALAQAFANVLSDYMVAQSNVIAAQIGRPANPIDGSPTSTSSPATYVMANAVAATGYLQSVKLFVKAAGTITIGRYTLSAGTLTRVATYTFAASATGLQTFSLGTTVPVQAGELLSIHGPGLWTFTAAVADGSGWYALTGASPASGSAGAVTTNVRLEVQFNLVSYSLAVTATAFNALSDTVAGFSPAVAALLGSAQVGRPVDPIDGTVTSTSTPATYVQATPAPTDGYLATIKIFVKAAGTITIGRYTLVSGTLTKTAQYTFTTAATGLQSFSFGSSIPVQAGDLFSIYGPGLFTYSTATTADGAGWYSVTGNTPATAAPGTVITALRLEVQYNISTVAVTAAALARATGTYYADRITEAAVTPTGLSVATRIKYGRDGAEAAFTDTRTIAAPAGSLVRYDVLWIDAETKAFGVTAGTERATDAYEFIPAIGAASRVPIANLRVSSAAIVAVPVWNLFDGIDRTIATQVGQDRTRARNCLRKFRAKIAKGAPIRIVSVGDSIQAIASEVSLAAMQAAPNGIYRDAAAAPISASLHYLRDAIGTPPGAGNDVVDALPLYTSTQLGRANDGAGQIHTKFGFMWELVNALDDTGYTLGADLFYDNFAISGQSSAGLVSAGAASPWMTAAVALAPDLIVFHMGMNEYASATTEANMLIAIDAAKAAGTECIVMGAEYKNSASVLTGWELTNRALRRAAEYSGVAFQPSVPLYDTRFSSALGVAPADRCAANRNNHPGIREHAAIGRELTRTVMA